jgi:translation initiation factor 4G
MLIESVRHRRFGGSETGVPDATKAGQINDLAAEGRKEFAPEAKPRRRTANTMARDSNNNRGVAGATSTRMGRQRSEGQISRASTQSGGESPWRRGPADDASPSHARRCLPEVDQAKRQVKSILNKLTRESFEKLYSQLLDCFPKEEDPALQEVISVVAQEVFAKATMQHSYVEMYADVCAKLSEDLKSQGVEKRFRHALLDQCQKSFNLHLDPPPVRRDLGCDEQFEERVRYKTKMLGTVRLIGQLLRRKMLATRIIFHCADELISIASPEAVETLCAFLETIGSTFDTPQWQGHARLEGIFMRIEVFLEDPAQCPRNRCLVRDILDKRKNNWRDRM